MASRVAEAAAAAVSGGVGNVGGAVPPGRVAVAPAPKKGGV